jgi:two-component system sensor histidine kinase FlrB
VSKVANELLPAELEKALEAFTGISDSLLASYRELERRAERVEGELSRANAELSLRLAELDRVRANLEAVLAALPTGVLVRDAERRIVRANAASCALLGSSADELAGADTHPMLTGPVDGSERETQRADGTRVVLSVRRSPIGSTDGDGRPAGWVEILDDRTELAELAERLHRADKMAALGTMAGGIAHEIRNPMNAIKGFAELLRRDLDGTGKAHRWATTISLGVNEVERIISSMLTLASPERLSMDRIAPGELVDDALAHAQQSLPAKSDRTLWKVTAHVAVEPFRGDGIKLRQALRNLVANAYEVQPKGGPIEVRVERRGDEVVFAVADGGPGIPTALRARVADPFFTTRAEGTGLGLSLVHTIAQLHGGRLEVGHGPAEGLGGALVSFRIPFNPI